MFKLSVIEHQLRLPPHLLNLPIHEAIKQELDSLFLDTVIKDLGLCVSVYDIKDISGGFIFPGDGASTFTVIFRMVVFCPFVGEVLVGKLIESDVDGLRLSVGFFDDIYIPVANLMPNCRFEPCPDNRYMVQWIYDSGDGDAYIDGSSEVRFGVVGIDYPPTPLEQTEKPFAPMLVKVAINFTGEYLPALSYDRAKPYLGFLGNN